MFNTYVKNSQSSSGLIKYRDRDKTISSVSHLRIKKGPFGFFKVVANFDFKPKHNTSKISFRYPLDLNQSGFDWNSRNINKKSGRSRAAINQKKIETTPLKQTINLKEDNLPSDRFLDSLEGPSSAKQLRPKAISKRSLVSKRRPDKIQPNRILVR